MFNRNLEKEIEPFLDEPQAIFILGPRRSGKTTLLKLLKQSISDNPIYYYDLERISDREAFSQGTDYFIKHFVQSGGNINQKNVIMIDEIQYLKDFASFIKIMVDHHSDSFKLILSGSSIAQIKLQFSDSLVGRKFVFHLYPLNFSEFLLFKGYDNWSKLVSEDFQTIENDPLSTHHKELRILFDEFLIFGGYPEVVLANSKKKKLAFLDEITNTYLTKDIQNLNLIEDIVGFNKLVKRLALSCGSLMNINNISNDVKLSHYFCQKYIKILESTFIIGTIPPLHSNKINEIKKMSKIYFIDIGLRNFLLQQFQPVNERIDKGAILENFVFCELSKKVDFGSKLYFWRTKNNKEIDFIFEKGTALIPIEVKTKKVNIKNLKEFILEYPEIKKGYILYDGKFAQEDKITYLPIWLC